MIVKKDYFCNCGNIIEKDEDFCIDCEIMYKEKYSSDESYTCYLNDELKEKYIR